MADDSAAAPDSTPAPPSLLQNLLPGILARAKVVVSPYPFATQDDDSLRVTVVNSLPSVSVEVHGRLVTRTGEAIPFRYVITPTSDRIATTVDFHLAGGFVSNLSAFAAGAAPLIGQTFVIVQMIRGGGAAAFVLGTLLSAYVTATQPIGWPGTPIESSIDGGGVFRLISGTVPAAGAEISESVPTGARWLLIALNAQLTTSATVATRTPNLFFGSAGADYFASGQPVSVVASNTTAYWWSLGMPLSAQVGQVGSVAGLLDQNRLLAGFKFHTQTSNLQAGDHWSAPTYLVQEWLEAA